MKRPTAKIAREWYNYDPITGLLTWKIENRKKLKGKIAGKVAAGYRRVRLVGGLYQASHVVWLYMTGKWPENEIDHKNLDTMDDSWANLREANRSQNCANKGRFFKANKFGFRGVKKQTGRGFCAVICAKQVEYCLGTYETIEEAARAYDVAAVKHHGEFARLNFPEGRACLP